MSNSMTYTSEQQDAIETRGRNILVAAAAGSGKTRVLVDRVVEQVRRGEVSLENVLILTFTNAAATEMRERIEEKLHKILAKEDSNDMRKRLEIEIILLAGADISTFHSFCQRLIRNNIEHTKLSPVFRIANEQELTILKHEVLENLLEKKYENAVVDNENNSFLTLMDAYGDELSDEIISKAILELNSFAQSQPSPITWLELQIRTANPSDMFSLRGIERVIRDIENNFEEIIDTFQNIHELVKNNDENTDLIQAWKPYAELIDSNIQNLEYNRQEFQFAVGKKDVALWDLWIKNDVKYSALRGNKYKALKENFPEIYQKFDNLNKVAKEIKISKFQKRESSDYLISEQKADKFINELIALTIEFNKEFQRAKAERNIIDFEDIQHEALTLLAKNSADLQKDISTTIPTAIADELRARYKVIMIDEYQDTNALQECIIRQIANKDNMFIVGDVKQSIYRFRLADPTLFQNKYETFPIKPLKNDLNKLISMSKNFRSRAEVLEPINYIFSQIMTKEGAEIDYDDKVRLNPMADFPLLEQEQGKTLVSPLEIDLIIKEKSVINDNSENGKETTDDVQYDLEEIERYELEAKHIANCINNLIEDGCYKVYDKEEYRQLKYNDIVILSRSVNDKASVFLDVLRREGIPAYANSNTGYFLAQEIELMLALLAVIDNSRRDIEMAAILLSPIGNITPEELAIIKLTRNNDNDYLNDIIEAIINETTELENSNIIHKLKAVNTLINNCREFVNNNSLAELLWKIYLDTGYYDYVGTLSGGMLKQANLRVLIERAHEYEKSNERGLFRFLRHIENMKKRNTDLSVARTLGVSENVVRIMSIHQSKGLEFPVVFLVDINKKFNLIDTRGDLVVHSQKGIAINVVEENSICRQKYNTLARYDISQTINEESKAEEMRLLYVALTRAKEKLILTGTINNLDSFNKAIKKLGEKYANNREIKLSARAINAADNYLQWIALSLFRHIDGQLFIKGIGNDDIIDDNKNLPNIPTIPCHDLAKFKLRVLKDRDLIRIRQNKLIDERLELVKNMLPLARTCIEDDVRLKLDWKYKLSNITNIPSKVTVTELKNRYSLLNEESVSTTNNLIEAYDTWRKPNFIHHEESKVTTITNKTTFSPTERGMIMHMIMQQINFNMEPNLDNIEIQIEEMIDKGILKPQEKDVVNIKQILRFLESGIGKRLRRAKWVYRELPFSRLLPASSIYDNSIESDEKIFIQGIIDVLFEDENDKLVLLDYKTDRNISEEDAKQRYNYQLKLYSDAVETILEKKIEDKFLFLLDQGIAIKV